MIGEKPAQLMAYHIENGGTLMYTTDAESAVKRFPDEWSLEPWPDDEGRVNKAGQVDVPEDWRQLSGPRRRALAIRLGAAKTVKADEATDLIAAEVRRRAPQQRESSHSSEPASHDRAA